MSIGNLSLDVKSFTASYLTRYDSLLQNATDIITKCDSYYVTKCDRSLLQNASGFLLQNATEFYHKIRQLLQVAKILLQNATFIANCNSTKSDRQPIYYTSLFNHLIDQM